MTSVVLYGSRKLLFSPSICKSNIAQSKRKQNFNLFWGEIKMCHSVLKPKKNVSGYLFPLTYQNQDFMCSISFALQMGIVFLYVFDPT